jgi:hypothetical protein
MGYTAPSVPLKTFEKYYEGSLAGAGTYTPSAKGIFSYGTDDRTYVVPRFYDSGSGTWLRYSIRRSGNPSYGYLSNQLQIGDGANLQYQNSGSATRYLVLMRCV